MFWNKSFNSKEKSSTIKAQLKTEETVALLLAEIESVKSVYEENIILKAQLESSKEEVETLKKALAKENTLTENLLREARKPRQQVNVYTSKSSVKISEQEKDDFGDRMARIRASLEKVSGLMTDLKHSKHHDFGE